MPTTQPDTPPPPVRIAYLVPRLDVGGTERALVALLEGLPADRFEKHVICLSGYGPLEGAVRATGAELFDMGYARRRASGNGALRTALSFPAAMWRLCRHLRARRIRVLHTMIPACNVYGAIAARIARTPRVCCTKLSLGNYRDSMPLLARMEDLTGRWFHLVHCKSRGIAEDVARREPIPRARMRVVYNGIRVDEYGGPVARAAARRELGVPEDAHVVGVVANLNAYKGHSDLIEAARRIATQLPRMHLVFVGRDDGIGGTLRAQAAEAGLPGRVHLVGPRSDIPRVMSAFDVLVSASHEEGFSNVLLEGMASCLPVIASNVGGNPEAVDDGVTGIIVPPRDPDAMAAALARLANDAVTAREMGKRGRERARAMFSHEAMVAGMVAFYDELLGTQG